VGSVVVVLLVMGDATFFLGWNSRRSCPFREARTLKLNFLHASLVAKGDDMLTARNMVFLYLLNRSTRKTDFTIS